MPHSVCLTTALPETWPSSLTCRSNEIGRLAPASSSSPVTNSPPLVGQRDLVGAKGDRGALEDLLVDRLADPARSSARGMHAAAALPYPQRMRVGGQLERRLRHDLLSDSVACQASTSIRRSCPALAIASRRPVRTISVAVSGPNAYVPGSIDMAASTLRVRRLRHKIQARRTAGITPQRSVTARADHTGGSALSPWSWRAAAGAAAIGTVRRPAPPR